MVTENLSLYGIIFNILGSLSKHIEHLSFLPLGKMAVLGFGSALISIRDKLIPKRLRLRKSSGKNKK